eukprot:XP_015581883.1 uncharacterized protein LOC8267756 isoform X2 [Ricinus communis]
MEPLLDFNEETILVDADDQEKSSSSSSYGYKLVPWLNWEEWERVRDSLFSDSAQNIASAITRVRPHSLLPLECYVTIIISHCRKDLPSDALHSDQMLAMLYCMAILRLVNCVVEKTRKKTEISIAEAAGAIGIPRTLIDIRHEGSHRDLPALTLVRDSAAKAIHWLKFYYWEPQTEQIPFQRDGTAKIRKEVKSKLLELASCLKVRESSQSGASPIKGKRLKKQATKTLKIFVHLYSSYSSEVLSVLLELILKALESSTLLEFPNQIGENTHTLLDDWKLVIIKLSNKEPELLLTLLKAILNMIETQEALKYETGTGFTRAGSVKIEQLSSLFAWLAGKLMLLKPFCHKDAKAKTGVSATELNLSDPILMELLRKCLLISSYGNKQLMDSTMHLAQLVVNSPSMEKLTKLSLLNLSDSDVAEENFSLKSSSNLLVQQDKSIHEAADKLKLVKISLAKRRIVRTADGDLKGGDRWAVAKSWNPCPIGMLPRDLGSSGCLPDLDHHYVDKELVNLSGRTWELKQCGGVEEPSSDIHSNNSQVERSKREASYDICLLDRSSVKKMREMVESYESGGKDALLPTDIKGCLMINGVWKKIEEEELLAIKSGIRILV